RGRRPERRIKTLVRREAGVQGQTTPAGALPAPPTTNSHSQNMPIPPSFDFPMPTDLPGAKPPVKEPPQPPDPTHYADVAVLAYRVPDDEVRIADAQPKLTTSGGELPLAGLTDGDYSKSFPLPLPEGGKPAWVRFDFAQPFRAQAFSIAMAPGATFFGATPPRAQVQSSAYGTTGTTLATLPGPEPPFGGFPILTYACPVTAAETYRVVMERPD